MKNVYVPKMHKIKRVIQESPAVKSFVISKPFNKFLPGQFIQITVPGYGEITLGITSPPKSGRLKFTVHKVGNVTKKLHKLKTGDSIGVRGPFGNGWPLKELENKHVTMIAGGVGIVPIKPLIHYLIDRNHKHLTLLYGAKTCEDLLFHKELKKIREITKRFVVEKAPKNWRGEVGMVTKICDDKLDCKNGVALICGPTIMMKFVTRELKKIGFKNEQIYLSLERLMQCGVGLCEHCRVGTKLVCCDGPVFRYDEVQNFHEVRT